MHGTDGEKTDVNIWKCKVENKSKNLQKTFFKNKKKKEIESERKLRKSQAK